MVNIMIRLLSSTLTLVTPTAALSQGFGHMGEGGYGYGIGMMFAPVIWLLVLGLVVTGVVWFVRQQSQTGSRDNVSAARKELDLRFAQGDIDAEDYSTRKKLLDS
jgi:putative membrane protein